MELDGNRETAIRLLKSVAAGESDMECLASDAMWWVLGLTEQPLGDFLKALKEIFQPQDRMEILGTTAERDRVAIEASPFMRSADGRDYSNAYHFLLDFRGDRFVRVKESCHTAYLNRFFDTDFFSRPLEEDRGK